MIQQIHPGSLAPSRPAECAEFYPPSLVSDLSYLGGGPPIQPLGYAAKQVFAQAATAYHPKMSYLWPLVVKSIGVSFYTLHNHHRHLLYAVHRHRRAVTARLLSV
jgi:hypothetical protein